MAKGFLDFDLKNTDSPRPEDLVPVMKLEREFAPVRMAGEVVKVVTHWVDIFAKDGRKVSVPRQACENPDEDPYLDLDFPNEVKTQTAYWVNAFAEGSAKPQALRVTPGLARKMLELVGMNDGYELSHPKKGRIVHMRFDRNSPPSSMYSAQMGDRDALAGKRAKAKLLDLSVLSNPPKPKDAAKDAQALAKLCKPKGDEDPNDEVGDAYVNDEVAALRAEDKRGKRRKGKGRREHQEKPPTNKRPKGKRHPKRAKSAGKKGRGRGGKSK